MAWGKVLDHPRLGELDSEDFAKLLDELKDKVRCYGYELEYLLTYKELKIANWLLGLAL